MRKTFIEAPVAIFPTTLTGTSLPLMRKTFIEANKMKPREREAAGVSSAYAVDFH